MIVTINWKPAISLKDFESGNLSWKEEDIMANEGVLYCFEGEKKNSGKEGVDIGQTTRSLAIRTKEHMNKKDYLEGFPLNQMVRCGIVSVKSRIVDKDLLEQVEGALIQYAQDKKPEMVLCNQSKTESYTKTCDIDCICNLGERGIFPTYVWNV